MKRLRPSKKQLIILAVVGVVLVLLFCLRGWVRNSVVPAYVEATSGKQLKKLSQKTLLPVQEQLAPFGFHFTQSLGYSPAGKLCSLAYFHNFKETVRCGINYDAAMTSLTIAQKDDWATRSQSLETWLAAHGWNREEHSAQSLRELVYTDHGYATYKKQAGATTCRLWLSSLGHESYAGKPSFNASTGCSREVKFFGGNDTVMDSGLF